MSQDASIRVTASSGSLSVPSTVTLRKRQDYLLFSATAVPRAATGPVTLTVSLFAASNQTTVTVGGQNSTAPELDAPTEATSVDGEEIRFQVSGYDPQDLPLTLSSGELPPGARFDTLTGEFSWEPRSARAGSYPVTFAATNSAGVSGSATVQLDVVSEPVLSELLHAATLGRQGACSPGALAVLKGKGLGKSQAGSEVTLSVNGEPVSIVKAEASRLTFVCPALEPGSTLRFQAGRGERASNVLEDVQAAAAPGVFTLDGSGAGQAVALLEGTGRLTMMRSPHVLSQPAVPLDRISILATGLGSSPAESVATMEVWFGDAPAPVESIVNVAPGIWQITASVPARAPLGNATPLRLALTPPGGLRQESNPVTIAIEPAGSEDR